MKKISSLLILFCLIAIGLSGCQKSEIEEKRAQEKIDSLSDKEAIDQVVNGKKTMTSIYTDNSDAQEVNDEFEVPHRPFSEKYDSPEKIKEEMEKYYSKEYSEELISQIPAKYVNGSYMIPLGDIGMIPNYEEFTLIKRSDVSEREIQIEYKAEKESPESFVTDFQYIDGDWKISDEIRKFESE